MIGDVPQFVGIERATVFRILTRCRYLSGMRLSEALNFGESREDCHSIVREGGSPMMSFIAKQKSRKSQSLVMTPQFEEFVFGLTPNADSLFFTSCEEADPTRLPKRPVASSPKLENT